MQSAFQRSPRETPTSGILISTSLDPDRAMFQSSSFWICSWFLADWSCAIPLIDQPTSRALDWIASSSLPVMLWTLWCAMGCNDAEVCVAQCWGQTISCASQLVCLFPHVQTQCVDQRCRLCAIWRPTLIRAHAELLQWSTRGQDLCQSSPLSRRQLLDGVFIGMIAILHLHAPTQRCHRRRRRPSWWTPECHQRNVAQNGAWRDDRRAPSAAARERFHNARTSFDRVVRRCQNQFWSDWQENITSLSRANPRAAASRVGQMFSGQSRRHNTHVVWWPQFSSSEPSRTDIEEQWRRHFVSVGSQSSSVFDKEFHEEVTRRFLALFVGPKDIGGQFDGPI